MQILILNQDWFADIWRSQGHRVVTAGIGSHLDVVIPPLIHVDKIIESQEDFSPDRIVVFDNSMPITVLGLDDGSIPTLFYSVDTHHHYELHIWLSDAFDETWVAQRDYLSIFYNEGRVAKWLPLWASKQMTPTTEKEYGASFVGSLNPDLNPDRVKFFEELQEICPVNVTRGDFDKIFTKSEIVINQTVKGDLNFRVFEAMMSGAMLLTERSENGLTDLFTDRKHCVLYTKGDTKEAAHLINYYLNNRDECRDIARAGHEEILRAHLPIHRANVVMESLKNLTCKSKEKKFLGMMVNFLKLGKLIEKKNVGDPIIPFSHALACAERFLDCDRMLSEREGLYLLEATTRYDIATMDSRGARLLLKAADMFPSLKTLRLAQVRILLNFGHLEAAKAVADILSPEDADKAYEQAEWLISEVLGFE